MRREALRYAGNRLADLLELRQAHRSRDAIDAVAGRVALPASQEARHTPRPRRLVPQVLLRRIELRQILLLDRLALRLGQIALADQLFAVDRRRRRVLRDLAVHQRLRKGGLITLVVPA